MARVSNIPIGTKTNMLTVVGHTRRKKKGFPGEGSPELQRLLVEAKRLNRLYYGDRPDNKE